jgi:CHASE3 domain sensor protein
METISDFKERIHATVKGAQDVRVQEKTYLQFYLPEYRKNLEDHARELKITLDEAAKVAGKAKWKEQIASIGSDFDNFLKQFSEIVAGQDRAVQIDKDLAETLAYCSDRIDKIILSLNNEHFQLQMEGGMLSSNKLEMLSVARDCKLFLMKLHTLQQTYLMTGDDRYSKEFAATLGGKDSAALSSIEQFAKTFKETDKIEFSKEFNAGLKKFIDLSRENQDLYKKDKALAKTLDDIGNRIIAQARELLADATASSAGVKASAVTAVTVIVGVTAGLCLLIALIMIRSITLPLRALAGFSQAVACTCKF